MVVRSGVAGIKGFDVDQQLSASDAAAFKSAGMDFCIRYIPRIPSLIAGNLTAMEMSDILGSGLALSVVQHAPMPNWMPSAELGKEYADYAVEYLEQIEFPKKVNVWLDLEMVSTAATVEAIAGYCKAWYAAVAEGNFIPGLYVGWQTGLSSQQLYSDLPFRNYWRGYNADIAVATRGYQILQHSAAPINGIEFDGDIVQADELGDLPLFVFSS